MTEVALASNCSQTVKSATKVSYFHAPMLVTIMYIRFGYVCQVQLCIHPQNSKAVFKFWIDIVIIGPKIT